MQPQQPPQQPFSQGGQPQSMPGIDLSAPLPQPGLFGNPQGKVMSAQFDAVSRDMNNLSRQIRIVEERAASLRRKTQVTDQNMLTLNKRIQTELKVLKEDINDLRKEVYDALEKIKIISGELKTLSPRSEVDVYKRYIDLWEPVHFVQKESLPKIIRNAVEEYLAYKAENTKN